MAPPSPHVERLLILDRALTHLTERHRHHTRLVGMMCFGGLAEVLEFSVGIVERDWSASRPGLQSQLCNLPK
jgi:hypothetical protein